MGIYSCKNAKVYGIKWFNSNTNNYEFKTDYIFHNIDNDKSELTKETKEIILNTYNNLDINYKNNMYIQMYTDCWSSIDLNNLVSFVSWYPITKDLLEEYLTK